MRRLFMALGVLYLQSSLWACMWDSDTLANEAQGVPDVVRVITGRFPRNPPLYYAMRLKRVGAELQATPTKLADYDDAAVACERLGHDDEATAWMRRKQAYLQQAQPHDANWREQEYHYLANIGTFWAHRWLRHGADRRKLNEMKQARDYIAQAIQLNPDAHFGREKYQLMAMDWIIKPPKFDANVERLPTFLDDGIKDYQAYTSVPLTGVDRYTTLPLEVTAPQEEKGISGLIVLGAGWESVDIFNALAFALGNDLRDGKQYAVIAYLAKLRCMELVDQGHKSLLPNTPQGKELKILLAPGMEPMLSSDRRPEVAAQYQTLRAEAASWQAQRTAYMMERLQAGRHPDTDPTFWKDWQEPALPAIYNGGSFWDKHGSGVLLLSSIVLLFALPCALLRRVRARRLSPASELAAGRRAARRRPAPTREARAIYCRTYKRPSSR